MSATGPVLLIPGGTGSVGSVLAGQALAAGWAVVVTGRDPDRLDALVARLDAKHPRRVAGIRLDIASTPTAVAAMVEQAAARFGRLDAVVDCLVTGPAGGGIVGAFAESDPRAYLAFADASIVYFERLAYAALPWLRQSPGCLVAIASDAALFPAARQALIGAARAATVGFVKNLALEVSRDGVRVHCVSPSYIEGSATVARLTAAGSDRLEKARRRAGLGLPTAADIAALVLFLCGPDARRMTGQVISVNGGLNV